MSKNIQYLDLGKIPPQCIDLEQAVLGALILEGRSVENINLKPEHFYKDIHQKIFEAIQNIHIRNDNIDTLTVTEELKKLNYFEEIGGVYYITQLTGKIASAAHIETHSYIIYDKYVKRKLIRFSSSLQQKAFDDSMDTEDILNEANLELDKINNETIGDDEPVTIHESLKNVIKIIEKREILYKKGKSIGIPTPIYKLTKWTSGWLNGKMIVIAGRVSMGKSAFALECATIAAQNGFKPCIFSLEMGSCELTERILIGDSGINADDLRLGNMNPNYWNIIEKSIKRLMGLNILFDNKPKSISKIRSRVNTLKRQKKCDFVIIDYLQLIKPEDTNYQNRAVEVSMTSQAIKNMAMELDIPVMPLAQLNREVERRGGSKKPQLSDLAQSGSIEADADIVGLLFRPSYYGITEDSNGNKLPEGYAELNIAKHRGGRTGEIEFKFNKSLTKIIDIDNTIPDYNPNLFTEPNTNFDNEKF